MSRRFHLHRRSDVTGISGTGTVAEGVQFNDGTVVLRWLETGTARPDHVKPTTVMHDDIESVIGLHGHDGATEVVWDDDPPLLPHCFVPAITHDRCAYSFCQLLPSNSIHRVERERS